MPGFVKDKKDEAKWAEAKEASGKETAKDSKGYWKLANFIFHKMKKTEGLEKAEEFMNSLQKARVDKLVSPEDRKAIRYNRNTSDVVARKANAGVHRPSPGDDEHSGKSRMGHQIDRGHTAGAKINVRARMSELKRMPKPNLPKSENEIGTDISAENKQLEKSLKMQTSVPNPMKTGTQATVKTPKAKKMPDPFGKPSLFFKAEEATKHPTLQKLRGLLEKKHKQT